MALRRWMAEGGFAVFLGLVLLCGRSVAGVEKEGEGLEAMPASARDIRPLLIGSAVPGVQVKTTEDKPFSLHAAALEKPTVLIFNRGGW